MKITLNIDYRTNWGESVYVVGAPEQLGGGDESQAVKMSLDGTEHWSMTVEVPDAVGDFDYRYIVRHDNGYTKHEWGKPHTFVKARVAKTYEVYDRWQDQPYDNLIMHRHSLSVYASAAIVTSSSGLARPPSCCK